MSVETREARAPNACAGARAHINTQPLSCIFVQQQPRGVRFFFFICFVSFGGGAAKLQAMDGDVCYGDGEACDAGLRGAASCSA